MVSNKKAASPQRHYIDALDKTAFAEQKTLAIFDSINPNYTIVYTTIRHNASAVCLFVIDNL